MSGCALAFTGGPDHPRLKLWTRTRLRTEASGRCGKVAIVFGRHRERINQAFARRPAQAGRRVGIAQAACASSRTLEGQSGKDAWNLKSKLACC